MKIVAKQHYSRNVSVHVGSQAVIERLTDSKQKTRIANATDAVPWVFIAATEKTKQRIRYAVSIYRGLKAFIVIKPAAIKRLAA